MDIMNVYGSGGMGMTSVILILAAIVYLAIFAIGVYLLILIIKALKKYIATKDVREETRVVRKSLSEALRENRTRCKMTQEFVAEAIGVSRQAVSKWENGTADPSTANLIALAKLYQVSVGCCCKALIPVQTVGKKMKNKSKIDGYTEEGIYLFFYMQTMLDIITN